MMDSIIYYKQKLDAVFTKLHSFGPWLCQEILSM